MTEREEDIGRSSMVFVDRNPVLLYCEGRSIGDPPKFVEVCDGVVDVDVSGDTLLAFSRYRRTVLLLIVTRLPPLH